VRDAPMALGTVKLYKSDKGSSFVGIRGRSDPVSAGSLSQSSVVSLTRRAHVATNRKLSW
jgi:hypothetical protein